MNLKAKEMILLQCKASLVSMESKDTPDAKENPGLNKTLKKGKKIQV